MSLPKHWADALRLRPELLDNQGQVADLRMSLYDAVYQTADVPYTEVGYYSDITEPTASLIGFAGAVAARLGSTRPLRALFHLDQGMGGGKSHSLVGLYHLGAQPKAFFKTDLGKRIKAEAESLAGGKVDLEEVRVVVLSADNMSPGKTNPVYGPATTLHERFLWSLFSGDKKLYQRYRAEGSDKASLRRAMEEVGGPVLILLDELMDYVMQLSDAANMGGMPGEKAFLNALMDAVDDVPQVAFVVVMIRSDDDERGYTAEAEAFRSYVAQRLERNGITVAVSEAPDFPAIIQRRLFERVNGAPPDDAVAKQFVAQADSVWREQVFDRLGSDRSLARFGERLAATYPFHPDLMALVRDDWSRHAGFQRVRSTVSIFAITAHHWIREHKAKRWAPDLIGVGDIPVTAALEDVLSSGLLHGNERAVQGFRQVAATDLTNKDGTRGRAVEIDRSLQQNGLDMGQPVPALRMASALFYYSLVARKMAKRGATKAELLASVFAPSAKCDFAAADEVFNALISDEEGLGALEVHQGGGGSSPTRYQLSTQQTLRMFYKSARGAVQPNDRDALMWERAQKIATNGLFDDKIVVAMPANDATPLDQVFGEVDQNGKNRLVILDPRRWTLLNGRDGPTRADINSLLGMEPNPMAVDNAASCVVVCVNTQRRDVVRKRAIEALAWRNVKGLIDDGSDQRTEVEENEREAFRKLDDALRSAYQHYAYLVRTSAVQVEWARFDEDGKTALRGDHVWEALVNANRAVRPGTLSGDYLKTLLSGMARSLSLKEVVQQFKKNPAFPLVSADGDIRNAIFQMLAGSDAYEITSPEGEPFTILSAQDLALGSTDQFLRKAAPKPPAVAEHKGEGYNVGGGGGATGGAGGHTDAGGQTKPGGSAGTATRYKNYTLKVPSKSVTKHDIRNQIFLLLGALSDAVDPAASNDLQLISIDITINAAEGSLEDLKGRAQAVDGAKWSEQEEDFFA